MGEWDWNLLAEFDEKLLNDVGFSSEEIDNIFKAVIQTQPMKMQTSAIIHSGGRSGEKHTFGRLYKVVQVHIKPNEVSPKVVNKNFFIMGIA